MRSASKSRSQKVSLQLKGWFLSQKCLITDHVIYSLFSINNRPFERGQLAKLANRWITTVLIQILGTTLSKTSHFKKVFLIEYRGNFA